jgi:hypothetical protein
MTWVPVLYTLNNGFTRRAQVFNHNSVLVMLIAAVAWRLAVAFASGRLRDWLIVGGLAGLALITKYQALLPLGLLALLAMYGFWRADAALGAVRVVRNWPGLIVALVVALIVTLPHLVWLWQSDFMPMRYASQALGAHETSPLKDAVALFVLQLRNWIPGLLVLAGVAVWHRWRGGSTPGGFQARHPWWQALIAGPMLALVILAVLGVNLQSHWGMQSLQFVVLGLTGWAYARWGAPRASAWVGWALLQAAGLALMATQMSGRLDTHRSDFRKVPAQAVVKSIEQFAALKCGDTLLPIEAPNHLAAMVLAYAQRSPTVLDADNPTEQQHRADWIQERTVLQLQQQAQSPGPQWQLVWSFQTQWPHFNVWGQVLNPERTPSCGLPEKS